MKKIFLLLALLLVFVEPAEAKKDKTTPEQKGLQTINVATAKAHVEFLASDWLKGREAGTEWGHIAGEYLVSVLKLMGATPLMEDGFVQHFDAYSAYNDKTSTYHVAPAKVEKIIVNANNRQQSFKNVFSTMK